jgi:hypothetical protein
MLAQTSSLKRRAAAQPTSSARSRRPSGSAAIGARTVRSGSSSSAVFCGWATRVGDAGAHDGSHDVVLGGAGLAPSPVEHGDRRQLARDRRRPAAAAAQIRDVNLSYNKLYLQLFDIIGEPSSKINARSCSRCQ